MTLDTLDTQHKQQQSATKILKHYTDESDSATVDQSHALAFDENMYEQDLPLELFLDTPPLTGDGISTNSTNSTCSTLLSGDGADMISGASNAAAAASALAVKNNTDSLTDDDDGNNNESPLVLVIITDYSASTQQ